MASWKGPMCQAGASSKCADSPAVVSHVKPLSPGGKLRRKSVKGDMEIIKEKFFQGGRPGLSGCSDVSVANETDVRAL